MEHIHQIQCEWQGNLNGSGHFEVGELASKVSVPVQFGGSGIGTNPEDLLLAAAANCYAITLAATLQFQKIGFVKIIVNSSAYFKNNMGPELTRIKHFVTVIANNHSDEQAIKNSFRHAEAGCMVAKTMKNNINISCEGEVSFSGKVV